MIKFIIFFLFLSACAKPEPYVASKALLERIQPNRGIIPAPKGCDTCHKIFADTFAYKYYPVRMSHKSHAKLGIGCTFCHRKAATSTLSDDYLMPEGHGFEVAFSPAGAPDKNPCRACHLYSSDPGKNDQLIPARCRTCHPSYSEGKPLPFQRWKYKTNLKNNHKRHFDMGIPCIRCHVGFDLMDETTLTFMPKMDICYECHGATGERKSGSADIAALEAGRTLFIQNCAMCHGEDGRGGGPVGQFFKAGLRPTDLTDSDRMVARSEQQLHDVIINGGPELNLSERMPAWEGLLSNDETAELVKYVSHISEKHQ